MIAFLIYLIESSICLTLLFGVYWLFFRKETFFKLNRFYLLMSIAFSLLIPVIHVSVSLNNIARYEQPVNEIHKWKENYSRIIALTDPEFYYAYKNNSYKNAFEDFYSNNISPDSGIPDLTNGSNSIIKESGTSQSLNSRSKFPWKTFILWTYLAGITFFFFRLVSLFFWIHKLIRKNTHIRHRGYNIIQLPEEVPPFSFFRYVFVSHEVFEQADFDQILEHEKTHIRQIHSFDLILAQTVCMIQWFNPLAWQLQKAIKTNHEYLADEQVLNQGFELFDYQSLLLTQLISIRSVELVNNFNLLSIQKRIAMMTKVKSGFSAKLKILLSVPFAIALFFLFADMTFYGSGKSMTNFISKNNQNLIKNYTGLWESSDRTAYAGLMSISDQGISVLTKENQVQEYQASMSEREIILKTFPDDVFITYQKKGDHLLVWWNDKVPTVYSRSVAPNSLHYISGGKTDGINLPAMKEYKVMDWPECFDIIYNGKKLYVGDQEGSLDDVASLVQVQKASLNKLMLNKMTAKLYLDEDLEMGDILKINQTLREQNLMKIAYMVDVPDGNTLQAHTYGRPLKLPPLDAKILSNEELDKMGISHKDFDAGKTYNEQELKKELKTFIQKSDKYVIAINCTNKTKYIGMLRLYDAIFSATNELRNEYAQKVYQRDYEELAANDQKEVRRKYPMAITLKSPEDN